MLQRDGRRRGRKVQRLFWILKEEWERNEYENVLGDWRKWESSGEVTSVRKIETMQTILR